MDQLQQDLRYALRSLVRRPGFALLAILTLALGIGANTAIFSVVYGVVLKPLPYPEPHRLALITSQFPGLGFDQFWVSAPEFVEFREHNRAFESVGAYSVGAANLGTDQPSRPATATVSHDLLSTLGVPPLRGRGFVENDTRPGAEPVAVLSYELWQRGFGGDEAILERTAAVNGIDRRIVGVMPRSFDVHDEKIELWLPLTLDPASPGNRAGHFLYLIGRLGRDATFARAEADVERLLAQWSELASGAHAPNPQGHRLRLDGLQDDMVGEARTTLWVLQAAVGFVLLIACANLASLLLARAESRRRELAIRAALGAGRGRLLRQFLTEGVLLALAGAGVGVLLAHLSLQALLTANPDAIPRSAEISVQPAVLLFTLAVAIATAVVFGLVPLAYVARRNVHASLQEAGTRTTAGAARAYARRALVVSEIALAVVLVVGAGLLLRTFWNLMQVDAGFDRTRLVTFQIVLPPSIYEVAERPRFFGRLLDGLEQVPGLQSAAAMSGLPPLRNVNANDTDFEDIVPQAGDEPGHHPGAGPIENVDYWQTVTSGYVETMGIPIVEGRSFEPRDVGGPPVAMINETLARTFFPDRSPIGRRVKPGFGDQLPWFTIVGVLKDVKQGGVAAETGTEIYWLAEQLPEATGFAVSNMNVVLRTSLPVSTLSTTIGELVRTMDASLPVVRLRTMEDVFSDSVTRERFVALLLAIFAALALALSAIGTYGVLSYLVTERRQEIGVRMALGASRKTVLGMVLAQGLSVAGLGLALGLGAGLALTRLMSSLLFGVEPWDPATLAAVAVFISAIALAACLLPARRATKVDPMLALREQ